MSDNEKYMSSVKVGPKGQIVIPKEIRDMFQISPGDTLLILADAQRGIALERYQVFEQIAIFQGRGRDIYPDHSESESRAFAQAIRQLSTPEEPEER